MPALQHGPRRARRGKTCLSCKAGTVPISTAKSQIGAVPYTVLVHECGGSISLVAEFVHVWLSVTELLHDSSCVAAAGLRCSSVAAVTAARSTVPTAAHRTPGARSKARRAGVTKRAGAVAWPMRRVTDAIAIGKRT
jgi:hypothetical protein